jgi:spermidine dehydrogenase
MQAGHAIRDGEYHGDRIPSGRGEHYDLVVVGGGFGGLGALNAFRKERPEGKALLLDNHKIFGGYAKANQFEVDGYKIEGAQASLNFIAPQTPEEDAWAVWNDLGLPRSFEFASREDDASDTVFAASSSGPLYVGEQSATTGYHFGDERFVIDMWRDDLARAPFSNETKRALLSLRDRKRLGTPEGREARRLDSMTFAEFASEEFGATPEALEFVTKGMCITGPQISAYGARALPGLERYPEGSPGAQFAERFVSFPAGNTVLARGLAKLAVPEAFGDGGAARSYGDLDQSLLDRPANAIRIRSGATVYRVANRADGAVDIAYEKDGEERAVTADGVVLAIGAWVAKHILADIESERYAALSRYHYSPILMVNIALRNWRFLDKLGISAARWFKGLGFYASIRKPMVWGGEALAPFHPDKPIVMTLYAPFPMADLPLQAQGAAARMKMFETLFAEYEAAILEQLMEMFGPAGFDIRRDVAGIVLNRWGHGFVTPPPGFFFAKKGETAPVDIMRIPHGRIAFGQNGLESWAGAVAAGERAVRQLLDA